ncbi:MAG: polysaccharide pyruvyl transferase family protein [Bacteroidaceae bacterium]|nr:polysaccharide pyruvyl transferase family protein [Bacteroidaceae bacterium]
MKKIILYNAPIDNGNRGCVALSITAMAIIDDIFRSSGEDYNLYLAVNRVRKNGVCQYCAEGLQALNYTQCQSIQLNAKTLAKYILKRGSTDVDLYRNADFIIDIGQGDSFADIYGKQRFELIDGVHRTARLFGKPYCLLPQTIGPFNDEKIRSQAVKSIEKATLVMARDKQSLDYVNKIAPNQKNVREYIDVAFFMPYKKMEFSKDFIHVGLNVSALLWNGGYTQDNQFGLKGDYQRLVRSLIDYFLAMPNVMLHLIAHVVSAERHIENDYAVNYDLWMEYERNPRLVLAPLALTPIDVKGYIAGLDFFMGARMHATIGAFSSGVPVVPMAYSRKFNGLFVDTLQYNHLADLKAMSEAEVLDKVKEAFSKREELKLVIDERMNGVVREREKIMIDDLKIFFKLN